MFIRIFLLYLILANILGAIVMYSDKQRAINQKYRISEKTLFLVALAGGSVGSMIGMHKFRHKTKHWYFVFGMPAIAAVQVILLINLYLMISG